MKLKQVTYLDVDTCVCAFLQFKSLCLVFCKQVSDLLLRQGMEGYQTNTTLFKINFLFNAMMFQDPNKNVFEYIWIFTCEIYFETQLCH